MCNTGDVFWYFCLKYSCLSAYFTFFKPKEKSQKIYNVLYLCSQNYYILGKHRRKKSFFFHIFPDFSKELIKKIYDVNSAGETKFLDGIVVFFLVNITVIYFYDFYFYSVPNLLYWQVVSSPFWCIKQHHKFSKADFLVKRRGQPACTVAKTSHVK